jgi:hypothetical protein
MALHRYGLFIGSMLLVVACGASRPAQRNCSKTNAVFQTSLPNAQLKRNEWEARDPSAAILLFKATSSQITVESRCNARLMHKLTVAQNDGRPPQRPLEFNNLRFDISNDTGSMELHSSSHCFFRIWDPRVKGQVENNPSLGAPNIRTILSNPLNRYQLYKSLLTSPQKLVLFSGSGRPIEFEYKFSGQEIYSQFFQKIDAFSSDTYRSVVGREFSKTSVILDELGLDVCGANEKLLQRLDKSETGNRRGVTDAMSFATFYNANNEFMKEPYRRMLISSGRNKTCISQTDFVVLPITFTKQLTAEQKELTNEIFSNQSADANALKAKLQAMYANPAIGVGDIVPEFTSATRFRELDVAEPQKSDFVESLGAPRACTPWLEQYPGLMVTAPIGALGSARVAQFEFKASQLSSIEDVSRKIFPNLARNSLQTPMAPMFLKQSLDLILKYQACTLKGFKFDNDNPQDAYCKDGSRLTANNTPDISIDSEVGSCPPVGEANRIHAAKAHLNVISSLRLAMATSILNLEKHRENHKESLLLPLAQLRDVTKNELYEMSSQNDRGVFNRVSKILDEMDAQHTKTMGFYSGLRVDSVGHELELQCSLIQRTAANPLPEGEVDVSAVFDNISSEAQGLINAGFTRQDSFRYYRNFAARYLTIRCTNASSQLLVSGFRKAPGLYQFMRDARISMIASDAIPASNQLSLSNKDLIETGRPVQVPIQQFILPQSAIKDKKYQHEVNAYLLSEGHVEIAYCHHQSLARGGSVSGYCEIDLPHREFLRYYKSRFPADFANNGRLSIFDPDDPLFATLVAQQQAAEKPTPKVFADALPSLSAHLNLLTTIPRWYPEAAKARLGARAYPNEGFSEDSGMYSLGAGDSGTTVSLFGLFPVFMVSAVNDYPVSGGLAVIPSTGGQNVQPKNAGACR